MTARPGFLAPVLGCLDAAGPVRRMVAEDLTLLAAATMGFRVHTHCYRPPEEA